MRRASLFLTVLVLAAILLAACGGEETATNVPATDVPTATMEPTSTEMPTGNPDLTTTPNVPVTGEESPNRLTNLMDYDVWDQNGEQIGNVDDMVLDFDNSKIAYVVVGTGGFLGLGEKKVLVPWNMLQMQTNGGTTGDQNIFLFTGNEDYYKNAPDADVNGILPGTGQPAADWDATVKTYWTTGVAPETNGTATQAPEGTATNDASMATATLSVNDQGQGNGMGAGQKMQGVLLASELLGSTIQAYGNASGQGAATAYPDATEAPAGTVTPTVDALGAGAAPMEAVALTVEDAIVDPKTGDIQYLVVRGGLTGGDRLLPVPLKQLRWDGNTQSFSLAVNTNGLNNAPAFQDGQYPDFSTSGWDKEIGSFWNNLKSDFLIGTPAP